MAELKCPKCGSKYVEKTNTTEGFGGSVKHYKCLSCQHRFNITTKTESAKGEWLMTFNGRDSDQVAEFYKAADGSISINQIAHYKHVTVKITPQLYVQTLGSGYSNIVYSGFKSPNDPNGTLFTVYKATLNDNLTKQALNNEAMKIVHKQGNIFDLDSNNTEVLLKDVCAYLANIIGATGKSGCYVATCVYGSYDCPEVWTLRRFRDNTLNTTWYGRAFIRTYYAISPAAVRLFGNTNWFKSLWKSPLDRMVKHLNKKGVKSTPYKD